MTKKILAILMAFTIITCLFSSCSDGTDEEMYYPIFADPISFDPQIASDNASKIVVFNCFEGLVRTDENGSIVPGVAKSWQISSDGLVYTFYLRENSKWYMSQYAKELLSEESAESFNYTVVAEDFVYGLQRAFNPEMGASTDSRLYSIKNSREVYNGEKAPDELGVTAINSTTLQITLDEPDENFLSALTQSAAMPCREEFFEATKGRYGLDPEKVIYNGPFYLYAWSTGSHLTLFRNENYSGENTVTPKAVYLYINNDLTSRADKISDGVYTACPVTVRQKALVENEKVTYIGYENSTWGFFFNCSSAKLTGDYNLRAALASSLDITQLPLPSHCEKYAVGIVPKICKVGNTSYRSLAGSTTPYAVNSENAVKSLEQAFENLEINNVKLSIVCHEDFEDVVKIAVQSWQSVLGVNVNFTIESLDDVSLEKKIKSGEFDIAFTGITASNENAVSFLSMFAEGNSQNLFGFSSKKFDLLLSENDKASQLSRIEGCKKAEQYLTDMCVVIPVWGENSYMALAEKVTGIYSIEAGTVPIFISALKK